MAAQSFDEAMKSGEEIVLYAPDGREIHGNYCDPKLDRNTMPEGWHAYDIRHDDDCCGVFCTLEHNYVHVNSAGTFFTQEAIPELEQPGSFVTFEIDEDDWLQAHGVNPDDPDDPDNECSADEVDPCPANTPNDWGYSFL